MEEGEMPGAQMEKFRGWETLLFELTHATHLGEFRNFSGFLFICEYVLLKYLHVIGPCLKITQMDQPNQPNGELQKKMMPSLPNKTHLYKQKDQKKQKSSHIYYSGRCVGQRQ